MSISYEIKSQLAKLLATEDLIVEHRQIETAQFDVQTRVLTLPIWDKAGNDVYDMLVGHEVGHALFTPNENWLEKVSIPPQFVNVVEDVRIEKLMKRKYAGLAKTFYRGYKELQAEDFFSISDSTISDLNLADRANLYFKIGNFVDISFDKYEESVIVKKISNTETFDDALKVAEELYLYCKKEKEEGEEKVDDIQIIQPQSGGDQEQQEDQDKLEDINDFEDDIDDKKSSQNEGLESYEEGDPQVGTADKLEENLRELISQSAKDNTYIEIPKLNLDSVIVNNKQIHELVNSYFSLQQVLYKEIDSNIFKTTDINYYQFKKSAQREVNYLVKEFECKKAADSYARATTARTGVLDTSKLHTYKYNEDLFKKVTTLADGKNHGLIFVLDWSGSMCNVIEDTCKQLYNLIWFCKKVSIPFEVYAFTNEWNRRYKDWGSDVYTTPKTKPHYKKKPGLLAVDEDFSMMNIFTSKTSSKDLENQMINIWRIASYFTKHYSCPYSIPSRMSLSGTPLNEALLSLHEIIPKFKKDNKVQKVHCIVLTDGEANQLNYHVQIKRRWDVDPFIGTRRLDPGKTFIRDRKLGTTYSFGYYWHQFTDVLLRNLKDKFGYVSFIGIRVLVPRDAKSFIRLYDVFDEKNQKEWAREKSFCIKNSGYDAYFGISATALSQNSEFEVDEGATKAKIKSAFAKSLKTKKLNKRVLGEFISLVV